MSLDWKINWGIYIGAMANANQEGTLIPGRRFDHEVVDSYLTNPHVRPGAKACLALSWRHREVLGLT